VNDVGRYRYIILCDVDEVDVDNVCDVVDEIDLDIFR